MPTAPGFAACSYKITHTNQPREAYLTFGVDPTDTDPATVAQKLAVAFGATGSLFACLDSGAKLVGTRVSLGTDGGEDIVGESGLQTQGTRSLNCLPPNCAVLVHKRTQRGGRRGRGRMYIPYACSQNVTNEGGMLPTADVTAVSNAVEAWQMAVSSTVGLLVLLHRPSEPGTEHPTTPGPPNTITSWSVDPMVATQRRRLGR